MDQRKPCCAIVGAGEGLGVALARAFARDGHDLLLIGRSKRGLASARDAGEASGAEVRLAEADAMDAGALSQALQSINGAEVSALIYNVRGSLSFKPPMDVTPEELTDILALEVVGAFAAAKAVLPGMLARGRGTIIYSSATAALRGSGRNLLYAAGKFGLRGMAQSLSKAYAGNGVHVAHVRLDCALDVPIVRELMGKQYDPSRTANPDDVAQSYLWIHKQPRSAWSNEIELRPYSEDWTC
jgi:short-subunit dehydrogenase